MTTKITILSRAIDAADCTEVVLRQNSTTRLVFRPTLLNSQRDIKKPVKGSLFFQKKKPSETDWKTVTAENLAHMRSGDAVKMSLDSIEIDLLVSAILSLYNEHRSFGITEFKEIDISNTDDILSKSSQAQKLEETVPEFFRWLLESEEPTKVALELQRLGASKLSQIQSITGLAALRSALELWESNKENGSEEFWQQMFQDNPFILAQTMSFPVMIVGGKVNVGGRGINNTGGSVVDFLYQSDLTKNVTLVEIKKPTTELLGNIYRNRIYNVSTDLSGGVMQLTNYKDSLLKHYHTLAGESEESIQAFNPRCVLVIGNMEEFDGSDKTYKHKSFELFRAGLSDIEIITFDELFRKIKIMADILEGQVDQAVEAPDV